MLAHGIENGSADYRLWDNVVKSSRSRTACKHMIVKTRNHDCAAVPASFTKLTQNIKTVDIRHSIIQNHAIGSYSMRIGKQGASCRIAGHRITLRL